MADQDNPAAPPATGPDWDHHEDDVFCPLCEYNLRGLIEPRCPECGYRFEWPDLLDPSRRLHPYLFEHHPQKNFRSFWRTAIGGWRPRRFWTSLQPVQPSRPRRLIAYWLIAASFVVLAYVMTFMGVVVMSAAELDAEQHKFIRAFSDNGPLASRRSIAISKYGSVEAAAEAEYPSNYLKHARVLIESDGGPLPYVLPAVPLLVWPWLTLIPLLIFRSSMRHAKIGAIHVLRCLLYSSDHLIWVGLLLLIAAPFCAGEWVEQLSCVFTGVKPDVGNYDLGGIGAATAIIASCIAVYRLLVACRCYLHLGHAVAVVLVSQIIVALLVFNVLLAYRVWL